MRLSDHFSPAGVHVVLFCRVFRVSCVSRWSGINFLSLISQTENTNLLKDFTWHMLLLIWSFNSHNTPVRLCLYTCLIFSRWMWISAVPVRLGGEKTCSSAVTHWSVLLMWGMHVHICAPFAHQFLSFLSTLI